MQQKSPLPYLRLTAIMKNLRAAVVQGLKVARTVLEGLPAPAGADQHAGRQSAPVAASSV